MAEYVERSRGRLLWVAVVVFMVAAVAVVVPTLEASGDHDPLHIVSDAGVILLSTGDGENWIRYYEDPADIGVNDPTAEQILNVNRKCVVSSDDSVLAINQTGGNDVRMVTNGLGSATKNNCSTANGRVDLDQTLTLTLGGFFDALPDVYIDTFEVDVEGKFGADLDWATAGDSGTVLLPNTSDNGPDSGIGDNNIAEDDPDDEARYVTFSPTEGEIAIEGGGDGVIAGGTERTNLGVNQSVFVLKSSKTFDGELDCDQQATLVGEEGDAAESVLLERGQNIVGEGKPTTCVKVPFILQIQSDGVLFDADLTGQENAHFTVTIEWDKTLLSADADPSDPAFNPPPRFINLTPNISDVFPADYEPVTACGPLEDAVNNIYEHPAGVPWCVAGDSSVPVPLSELTAAEILQGTWWQQTQVFDGLGPDPRFK